ncbi:MAG: hypothetical protein QOG28_6774 [Trebonia sp.]|jgi:type II secretory pathway pseudopilin PulG|nr:hypothetical protein [Actinomycetes bacterium]MDX6422154.1 hypothetical protein [Trebonia sp.]
MSGNVLALIVAIVGVVGTLASALLTQLFSLRLKRVELDERQQRRAGEQAEERHRAEHMDRRDSCVAVNMAARRFRQALKNCLFDGMNEKADELEQARQDFTSRYGEAQMILSDAVLKAASTANGCLAEAYGKVKATRRPGDRRLEAADRQKLENFLDQEVGSALKQLRHAMRVDLGVAD